MHLYLIINIRKIKFNTQLLTMTKFQKTIQFIFGCSFLSKPIKFLHISCKSSKIGIIMINDIVFFLFFYDSYKHSKSIQFSHIPNEMKMNGDQVSISYKNTIHNGKIKLINIVPIRMSSVRQSVGFEVSEIPHLFD